ncbi:MAG: NADH-quinone oxidoreductase subunit H [Polyangiaceae bacterium]
MSRGAAIAAFLGVVLVLPIFVVGVVNRTKALWVGRRGAPMLQLAFDLVRLLRKRPVYSSTTTLVFRLAPYVVFATALGSGVVVPMLGQKSALSFPFDFVWFAYVWGLGRVALMLAAMDAGSSFEGMGASREATFAALLEPTLFLVAGALCTASGQRSLEGAIAMRIDGGGSLVVWAASVIALFIVVQVESARMPVDDPSTHLELTMVHEVMTLDHSGPDLAALQYGSAIKMTIGIALLAALLNPWSSSHGAGLAAAANVGISLAIAVVIGTVESVIARFKLSTVPQYILAATIAAVVALIATSWRA